MPEHNASNKILRRETMKLLVCKIKDGKKSYHTILGVDKVVALNDTGRAITTVTDEGIVPTRKGTGKVPKDFKEENTTEDKIILPEGLIEHLLETKKKKMKEQKTKECKYPGCQHYTLTAETYCDSGCRGDHSGSYDPDNSENITESG